MCPVSDSPVASFRRKGDRKEILFICLLFFFFLAWVEGFGDNVHDFSFFVLAGADTQMILEVHIGACL